VSFQDYKTLVIPEASQRLSGTQGQPQCVGPWVPALRCAAAGMTRKCAAAYPGPRPYFAVTFSTARVMASTPVRMVGSGVGAKNGEWLDGIWRPSALALAISAGS
jgi:hypothetical protein